MQLSGSLSHPAIYPLHRQERIEYIKICFTEITKIRKKPSAAMPNKGFFAAQASGVESINPGASIVGACGALIILLHPPLHPSQILIRTTRGQKVQQKLRTHDFEFDFHTHLFLLFQNCVSF